MSITYKAVNEKKERKLLCGSCKTTTIHKVWANLEEHGENNHFEYFDNYLIVQCQGCKDVSFCKLSTNSDDIFEGEDGGIDHAVTTSRYPFISDIHKKIQSNEIPKQIYQVYSETHSALCGGYGILAAIGIRAVIDIVCKDKKAKGVNLFKQIDDLVKEGYLGTRDAKVLQGLRIMGNYSAHEAKKYTESQLRAAFDIAEHLIATVYIIPSKAAELDHSGRKTE